MKLFICGHAGHGKDTVAEMLKSHGWSFESSSYLAMNIVVRRELYRWYDLAYFTEEECYADRVNHRSKWFDIIAKYNENNPTKLAREIFTRADIYVGVRNIREMQAALYEGVADLSIWVDAYDRLRTKESQLSNTIQPDDCDIVIRNNYAPIDLHKKVNRLSMALTKGRMR